MYALRYPLCDNAPTVSPDITEPDPRRKVRDFNSPIALFVSKHRFEEDSPRIKEPIYLVEDEAKDKKKQETLDTSVDKMELSERDEQYEDNERTQLRKTFKENTPVEQDGWRRYKLESDLIPVAIQTDFLPSTFLKNICFYVWYKNMLLS